MARSASFARPPQIMAGFGMIVFEPNYRGSNNLGNAFQSAIRFDAGAGPGRDVMAGVAMLRALPYVDRPRTAVTGWSYGGFMTSWLIGNYPSEWTLAMAGAPVTDWEDQYNYGDGSIGIRHTIGGSPWVGDWEKEYQKQSPITYARRIRTPTLVMSHKEDFRVPPTQAMRLYRAMKDNGVETRFIGFLGRTHNPTDPVHAMERTRLWVEWVREKPAAPTPKPGAQARRGRTAALGGYGSPPGVVRGFSECGSVAAYGKDIFDSSARGGWGASTNNEEMPGSAVLTSPPPRVCTGYSIM